MLIQAEWNVSGTGVDIAAANSNVLSIWRPIVRYFSYGRTTPRKIIGATPGWGETAGSTDKRPSSAEQPQGTEGTRKNAEQDANGLNKNPGGGGGGAATTASRRGDSKKQRGEGKTTSGGVGWRGAQQQAATNTSARPGDAQTQKSGGRAREHERQGDASRETKTRGGATARAREAGPSDPAMTKGWRTTRAREAGPSVRARQTTETSST